MLRDLIEILELAKGSRLSGAVKATVLLWSCPSQSMPEAKVHHKDLFCMLFLNRGCTTRFNQDRGTRVPLVNSLCVPSAKCAFSGLHRLLEIPGCSLECGLRLELDLDSA